MAASTACKIICPCILNLRDMDDLSCGELFPKSLNYFQICCKPFFFGSETIFTSWEQIVANVTWNFRRFFMHSIVQMKAINSTCKGEMIHLVFLAPSDHQMFWVSLWIILWMKSFSTFNQFKKLISIYIIELKNCFHIYYILKYIAY